MNEEYSRYRADQARAWLDHCRDTIKNEGIAADLAVRQLAAADGLKAVDYSKERVKVSPIYDAMEHAAIGHMELAERLEAAAQESAAECADAVERLSRLANPTERAALMAYYLSADLPTVREVADAMCYSQDGMNKLLRRALCHAYEVMPHRWRDAVPTAV